MAHAEDDDCFSSPATGGTGDTAGDGTGDDGAREGLGVGLGVGLGDLKEDGEGEGVTVAASANETKQSTNTARIVLFGE